MPRKPAPKHVSWPRIWLGAVLGVAVVVALGYGLIHGAVALAGR